MVKKFKSLNALAPKMGTKPFRIFTDVSGKPFWTVVAETEADTLDEFFAMLEKTMANEEAGRIVGLSARQVQRWRSRWAAGDFSVDDRAGRGRKADFSPA